MRWIRIVDGLDKRRPTWEGRSEGRKGMQNNNARGVHARPVPVPRYGSGNPLGVSP
ncbi:hypothetical protein BDW59DRAFT_141671 [Aspergillus cavernicola]|uniref:Uncharacterized protein n=1 Tax=Aspergillus cavernicola TaxID=176166 RepID=A0ABR4IQL5_9EURO